MFVWAYRIVVLLLLLGGAFLTFVTLGVAIENSEMIFKTYLMCMPGGEDS
jgi:hypothetical protein